MDNEVKVSGLLHTTEAYKCGYRTAKVVIDAGMYEDAKRIAENQLEEYQVAFVRGFEAALVTYQFFGEC